MPIYRKSDELLSFRRTPNNAHEKAKDSRKQPLHPAVRRRRLIWLAIMVCFLCWTVVELMIQQQRIWAKEQELASKQRVLKQTMAETKRLREEIRRLHNEDYLLELAHKMGYSKPGEEVYSIKKAE